MLIFYIKIEGTDGEVDEMVVDNVVIAVLVLFTIDVNHSLAYLSGHL